MSAKGRIPPWGKTAAKTVVVLAVVVIVIHSFLLLLWGRALEHRLSELRAEGQPVDMSDVMPKPIPASENAATVYQQAFEAMWPPILRPGVHNGEPGELRDVPDEFLNDITPAAQAKLVPGVQELIARNAGVFPLLERATSLHKCAFPVKWTDGAYASLPHLAWLRKIERLVGARAVIRAEDGDMGGAVHDVILGLDVSDSLKHEPSLISLLVREALINNTLSALKQSMKAHPLSPAQARLLYGRLSAIDLDRGFTRALQTERAFNKWCFDAVRSDPSTLQRLSNDRPVPPSLPLRVAYAGIAYLWRPISYKDQMIGLDLMTEHIKHVNRPYREMVQDDQTNSPVTLPAYAIVSKVTLPSLLGAAKIRDRTVAQIGLAQTALAIDAYRGRFGSYPRTLDELKRNLGWTLNDDPFSGQPYGYKIEGKDIRIYSRGPNLKDDGGRTPEEVKNTADVDQDDGDIVWAIQR